MGFFLETLHEEMLYLASKHDSRTTGGAQLNEATKATVNGTHEEEEVVDEEREVARPISPSAQKEDGWLEVGKKQKVNVVRQVRLDPFSVACMNIHDLQLTVLS